MSLQPRIRRVLTLPAAAVPPVSTATATATATSSSKSTAEENDRSVDAVMTILRHLQHKIQPTTIHSQDEYDNSTSGSGGIPRHMIQHPVLPLVAYALIPSSLSTNNNEASTNNHTTSPPPTTLLPHAYHQQMMIVVQDLMTNEVTFAISWYELYIAYCHAMAATSTNTSPTKISDTTTGSTHLSSQMGVHIKSLHFYDPYTLRWSSLSPPSTTSPTSKSNTDTISTNCCSTRWSLPQLLMVQTEKCILFINLRRDARSFSTTTGASPVTVTSATLPTSPLSTPSSSSSFSLIHGYCNERTLRGLTTATTPASSCLPSSNVLPLSTNAGSNHTNNYVLIGCNDGTMKVIDYTNNHIVKRIKGLGKSDYVTQLLYANSYMNYNHYNQSSSTATTAATTSTNASTVVVRPRRILTVTKKGYIYMIEILIHDHPNNNNTGIETTSSNTNTSTSWTMDVMPPMARLHVPSSLLTETRSDDSYGIGRTDNIDSIDHTLYHYDPHVDKFYWYVPATTASSMSSTNVSTSTSAIPTNTNTTSNSMSGPILYVWDFKSIFRNHKSSGSGSSSSSDEKAPMLKPEPTMTIRFPSVVTLGNHNLLSPSITTTATTLPSSTSNTGGATLESTTASTSTLTTPSKDDSNISSSTTTTAATSTGGFNTKMTVLTGMVHPAFHEDTIVSVTVSSTGDLCLHGAAVTSYIHSTNVNSTIQAAPCMAIHLKQLILKHLLQYLSNDDYTNIHMMVEQIELKVYGATTCALQSPSSCGPCIAIATSWGIFYLELPIYSNPNVYSRCSNGNRIVHYGAGLGSYGKSIISVQQNGYITYASMDILQSNPVGYIEPKNVVKIYESHNSSALMGDQQRHRPFRFTPILIPSPSGNYICFFHHCEYRYEIYTTSSLIQQVGQARAMAGKNSNTGISASDVLQHRNLIVTSGTGICDFAWISDDDVFAILHASDLQEYMNMNVPKQASDGGGMTSPNLKFINAGMGAATNLAKTVTKTATTTAQSATKLATTAAVTTTTKTVGVTTKAIMSGAKGVKKTFGIFGKRKKDDASGAMSMTTSVDEDDEVDDTADMSTATSTRDAAAAAMLAMQQSPALTEMSTPTPQKTRQRFIELKKLEMANIETTTVVEAGMPLAICTSLGNVTLRGGNRKLPTVIFGGPVLCVASMSDIDDKKDGYGHFYSCKSATATTTTTTTKPDADSGKTVTATMYQATGPVLPYPDLLVWDDDGILCAIVVENRILVYVSNEPNFELLGTVRVGSPTMPMAEIAHLKFVHGTLFCCTYNSVYCVMLGDIEGTSICCFDTYLLASSDVLTQPENQIHAGQPLLPCPITVPLTSPTILGYQSGSLLVSTLRGVYALPLTSPLMRIGLLLAEGQTERAAKWFDAVDQVDHEILSSFLERRGYPELALQLYGISLETIIDISMRYGYIERLEDAVETYGVLGLRAIDMGRGVTPNIFGQEEEIWNGAPSIVVCVGAFLLAHGRIELARRLATECLRSGEQGHRDALFLGALLLPVDKSDATRLIQRAVMEDPTTEPSSKEWLMRQYVREFVLPSNSIPN